MNFLGMAVMGAFDGFCRWHSAWGAWYCLAYCHCQVVVCCLVTPHPWLCSALSWCIAWSLSHSEPVTKLATRQDMNDSETMAGVLNTPLLSIFCVMFGLQWPVLSCDVGCLAGQGVANHHQLGRFSNLRSLDWTPWHTESWCEKRPVFRYYRWVAGLVISQCIYIIIYVVMYIFQWFPTCANFWDDPTYPRCPRDCSGFAATHLNGQDMIKLCRVIVMEVPRPPAGLSVKALCSDPPGLTYPLCHSLVASPDKGRLQVDSKIIARQSPQITQRIEHHRTPIKCWIVQLVSRLFKALWGFVCNGLKWHM